MNKYFKFLSFLIFLFTIASIFAFFTSRPTLSYLPEEEAVLNLNRNEITHHGEIKVDEDLLELGRRAFYEQTFGNEIFLSDIVGLINGPLPIWQYAKALFDLEGEGTTNLKVQLAETVTIGGKEFKKGDFVSTGIDVAKDSYLPLGMPIVVDGFKLRAGISCAFCHSTVDEVTKKVIVGAPNHDLNAGLLLAFSTNSAAYFTHSGIKSLHEYTDKGKLPNIQKFENAIDSQLLTWAPGSYDTTTDLTNNPTNIPDTFTKGDFPYGWSGNAFAGAFKGLSVMVNNIHAQNSDSLAQMDFSKSLFNIDKEVYIATILQNSAEKGYRYKEGGKLTPSEFLRKNDPTKNTPGINELITPTNYPKISAVALNGTFLSRNEYPFWKHVNALSAFQNTLKAPQPAENKSEVLKHGQEVFKKAKCISCHSGEAFTNNKVISVQEIKTQPSRAKAFKNTEQIFGKPIRYAYDARLPVFEKDAVEETLKGFDKEQINMSLAHNGSEGGYKVKGLKGLARSAPYLHDGGVAMGVIKEQQIGLKGTLLSEIRPDPYNSLLALIDRSLRQQVIESNRTEESLASANIDGSGHEYWVDKDASFSPEDQDALIHFLLSR